MKIKLGWKPDTKSHKIKEDNTAKEVLEYVNANNYKQNFRLVSQS